MRSLVSRLLLLVLVPILAEAFSVSRSGNIVTLNGCNYNLYYQGTRLLDHVSGQNYTLTVNKTTEGVYECVGTRVTVLRKSQAVLCIIYFIIFLGQFEINNTLIPKTFTWGQRQVLDCVGYEPGNYHSQGYEVTWLLDGRQRCFKNSVCEDNNFNIISNNFSLSLDYYPTFTTFECQIKTNQDRSIQPSQRTVTVTSYTLSSSNNNNGRSH